MINPEVTINQLNALSKGCMLEHIGIEFTEVGSDYILAKMPVDHRTHQPFGILHGGASLALAESLGSIAAHSSVDTSMYICAGQEINANHIKSVRSGFVYGKAQPIHLGKTSHVWQIKITNEKDELVCISRLTVAIIKKK